MISLRKAIKKRFFTIENNVWSDESILVLKGITFGKGDKK